MEKVKVLVIEDEVIIAKSIISMIEKMGYECVGTAIRAKKGLELAKNTQPDIALLDINLKGEETGVWLARQLKKEMNIPYIFLTSLSDKKTIDEAKTMMPYGYLLKPVEPEQIFSTIEIALAKFSAEHEDSRYSLETKPMDLPEGQKPVLRVNDALFIKDEYQFVKMVISEIEYIKSDGNYVEIHSKGLKRVLKETLKNIEQKLPADTFYQTHRSYLVNVNKIESITGNSIKFDDVEVPIVKEKKDLLLSLLGL